jgi:large subunit ribosomal protein L12
MEYVYAAMLLHAAGQEITDDAVTKVLKGAGVDVDSARVKALVASLAGVDIADAMTKAVAAPAAAAAPAAGGGGDAAPAAEEAPAEEEDDDDGGFEGLGSLFG